MKRLLSVLLIAVAITSLLCAQNLPAKLLVARDNVEYPPNEHYENGKLTGFHVELVQAVAKRLGITIEWTEVPWSRALSMVENGTADAITYIGQTTERERWAIFVPDNVLTSASFNFIIRKDSESSIRHSGDVAATLRNRTLLVVRNFALPEPITKANPQMFEAPTMASMVDMLVGKRYDIAIVNKDDFTGAYRNNPAFSSIVILDPPVSSFANYIAFSKAKNHQNLANRFATEMAAFKKTAEYQQLVQRFTK